MDMQLLNRPDTRDLAFAVDSPSVAYAHQRGIRAAARIQAAAYATHVAVAMTGLLSADEERLVRQAPLAELRLSLIVDAFAGVAASEIVRLGQGA